MIELPNHMMLIKPTLYILKTAQRDLSVKEIEEAIIKELEIPMHLAQKIHSGNRTELQYRLAWARTKLRSQGLIENPQKGKWKIVDVGQL